MLISPKDKNEVSESYFFLSLAHTNLQTALISIGLSKLHAGKGNAELKGIDEVTDTLDWLTETVGAAIIKMGDECFGSEDAQV